MGGHVVYVKKEEEGAKDSALWDSRFRDNKVLLYCIPDPACTLLPALLVFYWSENL